jgi:hypothetical protein
MDFGNFGVISHTKDTKIADFITYLEEGKVMATKCKKCQGIYFPPKIDCPKCLLGDMEWKEIKGNGELISYTVVQYGPTGFEDKTPYTLGIAEFPGGIRALASLNQDIPESETRVGMKVKVVSVKLPPDRISYEFQKVRE